jgi:hypothetical protein
MQDRPPRGARYPGVDQIETRFTASIVPSGKHALVDLSGVTFLSSMGIRMLVATALARTADARHSVDQTHAEEENHETESGVELPLGFRELVGGVSAGKVERRFRDHVDARAALAREV